ncbi:MAG: nucleolar RNA-binding Nop10p family protein [Candidatus Woesearchaeota archaeon]
MKHILRCPECESYGLKEECDCGGKRIECRPPKLNSEDKYGHYRRMAKDGLANNELE